MSELLVVGLKLSCSTEFNLGDVAFESIDEANLKLQTNVCSQ